MEAEALRRLQALLLDRRGLLHGQVRHLRGAARRLERARERSLAAHVAGSALGAAGAVAAIVGLSLSPATLGASLLASAVGLGVATAGGAVSLAGDLSAALCHAREARRAEEIAATCRARARDVLGCLRGLGRGGGRDASAALYHSVCCVVVFGSRGFLVPSRAGGAGRVSQAVLQAKIQKLAESLESCTGALDELSRQLESRVRLCTEASRGHDLGVSADRRTAWLC